MEEYIRLAIARNPAQNALWQDAAKRVSGGEKYIEGSKAEVLADLMAYHYLDQPPTLPCPYGEILFLALNQINWILIARSYIT